MSDPQIPSRLWHSCVRVCLHYCAETVLPSLKLVGFRCQPEPGADHEGAGTGRVLDHELGWENSELTKHEQAGWSGNGATFASLRA